MASNILFILEGQDTEKKITENLTKYFIKENSVVHCAYCSDLYLLYKEISEDTDLDIFVLLKEIPTNKTKLSKYNRNDFSEIYMFFDYDGHATMADDNKVIKVLNFFNEETTSGKLFISYPMVESLKHFSPKIDFKELKVKAKENIKYKQIVGYEAKNELKQITKYTKKIWIQLIELHLKKVNFITNEDYSLPMENISQDDIFSNQLDKYINNDSTVAILSSFPVFLFEYYGYGYISRLLLKQEK